MTRPPLKRFALLLGLLFICAGMWWSKEQRRSERSHHPRPGVAGTNDQLLSQVYALIAREQQLDQMVWAKERRAEACGAVFDALWDKLNKTTNKFECLAAFPFGELVLGNFQPAQALGHGMELLAPAGTTSVLARGQWRALLADWARAGWQLEQLEFRHRSFDPDTNGEPANSRFHFRADVLNPGGPQRATVEGDLLVDWLPGRTGAEPAIQRIDASRLSLRRRRGEPPFRPLLVQTIEPPQHWLLIDPLILYDLDGDGLSEILLPASNLLFRRRAGGGYQSEPLCKYPAEHIHTAVVADFDGDGLADLLCATAEGLFLFKGSAQGTFDEPGRPVWSANPPLKYGQVLACGDIDGDGDLDVFLAQYKSPYFHGQMPAPYYNANDGDPAYLLLNDGQGNFTDATVSSGLGAKRCRRTYSASFVKFDGQQHLDLMVVSDFCGVELYRNDGHGHFTDNTSASFPDACGLGMAHSLSDFNADGRLDLLMIGMGSPTVERLEHLGLWRADAAEDRSMRSRLTAGNRLFLARPEGGFTRASVNDAIAQSGWAWGCSTADLDNDGFPDIYIANGHETRSSVREYEPEYWLHDIYVGQSRNDPVAEMYFRDKYARTRGNGYSYGGYEKNRLYLNRSGSGFDEAGYLMGVALEQDCRNVVADDLDGDGRMDLLVTTYELWPEIKQTLRVYQNMLPEAGNWIGFRFREQGGSKSPVGAQVTLEYGGHRAVREIVTGDSLRSQSANTLHFGLGTAATVDRAEILWPNGQKLVLPRPEVNRYHPVR